ncbi:MFS transporter [Paucibacter sp. DJ1R-11]|uniref:MFS transporter n=1 Tax=Paucibacter sp. DJ1R-11 TaxID=2893556 RepID=UPI0021E4BF6B|nr:MFS transporter [Paucibacter sp. DJ1R-11]MCV2362717.1 MFS transporter [Paucibacter sp. DJ1R-11]
MRLPNLLGSRNGRLSAFFFLYMTEGIPLGFAATAVATQLRRMGVGPAEIGAFVAAFYLPWAFKWAFGPLVDVFRSQRFGHRRAWILGTQLVMAATLGVLVFVKLPEQLALFTIILLVHNSFAAMQDVAIDALACNTLHEDERGLANGLMFAGAAVGQAVGGSGVLFLMAYIGFQSSFVFVAVSILAVTGFVVLPMKEALAQASDAVSHTGKGLRDALGEMRRFAMDSFRSFIGTRGAYAGVFFALLPCGAMSLSLALQSNLSVELGLDDDQVAWMNLATSVLSGVAMVVGGMLSDRIGRRLVLSVSVVLMSLPVLYLAFVLQQQGYVMPRAADSKQAVEPALVSALWVSVLAFNVFMGLMYGVRSALFMDVTNPKVAATQFTAYMALMNLSIAYTATWQGQAIESFGYPVTLLIDAVAGLSCLLLMHLMKKPASEAAQISDSLADRRARQSAWGLGLLCLAWLPFWALRAELGAAAAIASMFFTVFFVMGALFLLAGREALGQALSPGLQRLALGLVLPLLAMYGRRWVDGLQAGVAPWLQPSPGLMLADALIYLVPLLAGLVLVQLARRDWAVLSQPAAGAMPSQAPALG